MARIGVPEDGGDICLSFYWHESPEVLSFRRVLHFLVRQGYEVIDGGPAVRAPNGWLPRARPVVRQATETSEVRECVDASECLDTDAVWAPLGVDLRHHRAELPPASMSYGRTPYVDPREPFTIRLRASAAALELLLYGQPGTPPPQPDEVTPEVHEQAQATARFENELFRAACEELTPDLAGHHWCASLPPPSLFLVLPAYSDEYDNLFLHTRVACLDEIGQALRASRWKIKPYHCGTHVERVEKKKTADYEGDVEQLKTWVRRLLRLTGSRNPPADGTR